MLHCANQYTNCTPVDAWSLLQKLSLWPSSAQLGQSYQFFARESVTTVNYPSWPAISSHASGAYPFKIPQNRQAGSHSAFKDGQCLHIAGPQQVDDGTAGG